VSCKVLECCPKFDNSNSLNLQMTDILFINGEWCIRKKNKFTSWTSVCRSSQNKLTLWKKSFINKLFQWKSWLLIQWCRESAGRESITIFVWWKSWKIDLTFQKSQNDKSVSKFHIFLQLQYDPYNSLNTTTIEEREQFVSFVFGWNTVCFLPQQNVQQKLDQSLVVSLHKKLHS
jgi:hypothetical protein